MYFLNKVLLGCEKSGSIQPLEDVQVDDGMNAGRHQLQAVKMDKKGAFLCIHNDLPSLDCLSCKNE